MELSFVFHNRGDKPLTFGYESINVKDSGCFKFIHIDWIKDPQTKLNYRHRQNEPNVIFFERYETETFEQKAFRITELGMRGLDVPDLIQP